MKVTREASKDVSVDTKLIVKCGHLWDSLPELLRFLYLPVSCHWVPHIDVYMYSMRLALPSMTVTCFTANLTVNMEPQAFVGTFPYPYWAFSLWTRHADPEQFAATSGSPMGFLVTSCFISYTGPPLAACLRPHLGNRFVTGVLTGGAA